MKKVGIFFGSSTGYTEDIANRIATRLDLGTADIHNITDASPADLDQYEVLLFGTSTWGIGELQDDWYDFKDEAKAHLEGKEVGLFGTGDSASYDDSFCDAVGVLYDEFQESGCTFIGAISTDGYSYSASMAERDGKLVGLLLDEMNEPNQTDTRIQTWIETLSL